MHPPLTGGRKLLLHPVPQTLAPSLDGAPRPTRRKAWALLLSTWLSLPSLALAAGGDSSLEVRTLSGAGNAPSAAAVIGGALDQSFVAPKSRIRHVAGVHWVRLRATRSIAAAALPVLVVGSSSDLQVALYPQGGGSPTPLTRAAVLPEFGATQEAAFLVPRGGLQGGQVFYARMQADATGADPVYFTAGTLERVLARGTRQALMIALACGALAALALATATMWFVLSDKLFILYAGMTGLQALYLAYFSGQGFRWPGLAAGSALVPYAWDVPVALSGAMASLFAREITDLRHASPRVYAAFGWMAAGFVALAMANAGMLIGLGHIVVAIGNLMFLGAGVFVLVAAFVAWRHGNRAAGWFLCAWMLLETFAIVTSARLLVTRAASDEALFYYGLPGSMVASAILTSLGVADGLRQQRHALTEAERRAKTDPLTGVLNRRSLLEQLEAACRASRANGLPVAVLFLDLDFFKTINDSYGHAAGDACLAAVIQPIQAELRQSDVIGRYGGEEFVVVLTGADAAAAQPIAERIRMRVAEQRIDAHGAPIQLTCSIGVASSDPLGVWGEALIAQADTAVYAAKRLGRNRVQVAIALAA
ncbi:MAG: diguanylate cyclase [Gammaproteobacteria bacterium]|nr:diguanylate cyclase [Gammaproteobacteria bacterium]